MARVLVGMSGGVDSAVAAALLARQGHDVVGVFLRNGVWAPRRNPRSCCSADDAHDARRAADRLGLPLYALNLEEGFRRLIDRFVESYARGETPNPCVRCNRELKFGRVFDVADAVGAEFVATGHYARVRRGPPPALLRGADLAKDQSYMLFNLPPERLPRVLFPLGDLVKAEVRRIAAELGLPNAAKPDSQGVCFIPDGDLARFLAERLPPRPGPVVTSGGRAVGRHGSYYAYTRGQRHGLGVALGKPSYVTRVEPETATVVLGADDELDDRTALVEELNWLAPVVLPLRARVKVRYHHEAAPAWIEPTDGDGAVVRFDEPVRAVTPGQAAVFYRGDEVLGGGWIRGARDPAR